MGFPDSLKCEVEFTAGVWTDVTDYTDWSAGGSTRFGRSSSNGAPQVASLGLTLDNTEGRFSPGRQVLKDGTTAHPYYPDVRPRRRVRYSWVVSGVTYVRYTGYIRGFPQTFKDGVFPRVQISATDRNNRLGKGGMLAPIRQQVTTEGWLADPTFQWWPLTDDSAATTAADASGNGNASLTTAGLGGAGGGTLTFGGNGPGSGNGTGANFAPASLTDGKYLRGAYKPPASLTLGQTYELWIQVPTAPAASAGVLEINPGTGPIIVVQSTGKVTAQINDHVSGVPIALTSASSICDGGWHHIVVWVRTQTANPAFRLYVDGVAQASGIAAVRGIMTAGTFVLGASLTAGSVLTGNVGYLGIYDGQVTSTQVTAHYTAGRSFDGELVSDRIKRFLGYGGLTAADWTIDTSTVVCGTYPQESKSIAQACHDAAETEGGGSVYHVGTDGKAQFRTRNYRDPATPVVTISAVNDIDGDPFASSYDEDSIVTQVTGNRATASGTASSQTVTDTTAEAEFGTTLDDLTSYASTDADVLYNAQDRLAQNREPGYRILQLTVDLITATTAGLYAAIASAKIGDRLRLTDIPPSASPRSTMDFYIEGWSDSFSNERLAVTFDLSPADNPPRGILNSATYGRLDTAGATLSGALTASATTLAIATTSGPTFVAPTEMVTNRGFEVNTTGWAASSGTLTRDTTEHNGGVAAGKLATTVANGVAFLNPQPAGASATEYTGSAALKGTGTARLMIVTLPGFVVVAQVDVVLTSTWQVATVTGTSGAGVTNAYLAVYQLTGGTNNLWIDDASLAATGDYPLTVTIGEEDITLSSPASGSTSPQTFTGITRGVNGSTAVAHASGAAVQITNALTLAL